MIEINNLTTNQVDEEFLKNVCQKVLRGESASWRKENIELSLALIGQGKMRKLNKKYRNKNKITDVLAFPELKMLTERFRTGSFQKTRGLGEIVVCLREVKKNAKKFNSTFEQELKRCLIHGVLHLLGYDHEKGEKEAKIMEQKEKYYFEKIKNQNAKIKMTKKNSK